MRRASDWPCVVCSRRSISMMARSCAAAWHRVPAPYCCWRWRTPATRRWRSNSVLNESDATRYLKLPAHTGRLDPSPWMPVGIRSMLRAQHTPSPKAAAHAAAAAVSTSSHAAGSYSALSECVSRTVRRYLADIGDAECSEGLHALVLRE